MKKFISIGNKNPSLTRFKILLQDNIIPTVFITFLIIMWELTVKFGLIKETLMPAPSKVLIALFYNFDELKYHILVTTKETFIGFLVAIILGICLAILMDQFTIIKKALYPLLVISQTVPLIVLAPLFAIWFGFGMAPKIVIVIMVCFFPIVISLFEGLESADIDMINLMRTMNASKIQIFRFVKFPSGLIGFFSGLRIAATYSVMGAIIGEWTGASKGLGTYMVRSRNAFALDRAFASVLLIILMSWIMFKIVTIIQSIVMPWTKIK